MIYIIITNRPRFLPFAIHQAEKCSYSKIVILANGEGFEDFKTDHELIYKKEWRYAADCFNWYVDNCEIDDDIFLMDDDIYLKGDSCAECKGWIEKGFDKVVYTMTNLYDVQGGETCSILWRATRVGGAWAMSKDLWRQAKFADKSIEAMFIYFHRLPDHNVKKIIQPNITHLIHNHNVVNKRKRNHIYKEELNDPQLLTELALIKE